MMSGVAGGSQGGTVIHVDGAYMQNPEELANIIAEKQIRISRRNYRSTAY